MRKSAGILLYRRNNEQLEFLLVHPGGPFWANKDLGAWSIPKGEYTADEEPLMAAIREFKEETGYTVNGPYIPLSTIKQKAGKEVIAWGASGNLEAATIQSNSFKIQWPPKSGKWITVPEVDKAAWFEASTAKEKINAAQVVFLDELINYLKRKNSKNN